MYIDADKLNKLTLYLEQGVKAYRVIEHSSGAYYDAAKDIRDSADDLADYLEEIADSLQEAEEQREREVKYDMLYDAAKEA